MVEPVDGKALSSLRRGVVEYCVLALIREGDAYAFDIARVLAERNLVASEGTIYPLLSRLRKDGLVTSFWQESESGPPRRYYRLTSNGSRALECFMIDWQEFKTGVDLMLGGQRKVRRNGRD